MAERSTFLVTGALPFRGVKPGGVLHARFDEKTAERHIRARHISRIEPPPQPPVSLRRSSPAKPDSAVRVTTTPPPVPLALSEPTRTHGSDT